MLVRVFLWLLRLVPDSCWAGLHTWAIHSYDHDPKQQIMQIRLCCQKCLEHTTVELTVEGVPIPHTPRISFLRGPLSNRREQNERSNPVRG